MKCRAPFCTNKTTPGFKNIGFFRFPMDDELRDIWRKFCGLSEDSEISESCRLCSFHFESDDIYFASKKGKILRRRTAVPVYKFVAQIANFQEPDEDWSSVEHEVERKRKLEREQDTGVCSVKKRIINNIEKNNDTALPIVNCGSDLLPFPPDATEVRCSESQEHRQICANTKKVYERRINALHKQCHMLEVTVKEQHALLEKQSTQPDLAMAALDRTFNPDQVDVLVYNKTRPKQWRDDTITESLKTKFVCGKQGYEHERKKYPLPSQRTLQRRMEDLAFDTGVLNDVIELLGLKVGTMETEDLDCGIVFDEMSIGEARSYCLANDKFYGDATISGVAGAATHALVVMLVGIRSRWKQVVGYHFTGNTIFEGALKDMIFEIIEKVEAIGCKVHFITSDCGPNNKKLWNCLGLQFHKVNLLQSQPILHPLDNSRTLEIIPDPVHVFKSAVQGWIKNEKIFLPEDVVKSNGFTTNEVSIFHLSDLVHYEKQNLLTVAYGLKPDDVDFTKKRNNFDAMKVINSHKYVNSNVSAALRFYSHLTNRPEVLPTAYFIECLAKWFRLSTSRSGASALSKGNHENYEDALQFFASFKLLAFHLEVGLKKNWKPWQSALILATNSIIRLQDLFLNHKGYRFLLTSRFTQDCVENLFSQIRIRQKKPTALQFKNLLKSVSISQFLTKIPGSSYDADDQEWLINFPSNVKQVKENKEIKYVAAPVTTNNTINGLELINISKEAAYSRFDDAEKNVIYHIAGMVLYKSQRMDQFVTNVLKNA